jgi:hypothetical protein
LKPKKYNLPHSAQLRYAKNPPRVRYKQALQNMVRIKTVSFPATAVMVTDPVAKVQVGCVAVNVGAAGVAGCALSVMFETEEIQPAAFCAVTV